MPDPENAPTAELLRRLAAHLIRQHEPAMPTCQPRRCRACGESWPCLGRRLGERGWAASADRPE
ncbi:hypothetical protein [Longispora fulva]|uniref:Uncharacterized protein n=1 Tax=Longispora fulva TaxID=619741 RepID=A0A8J7GTQ6_9ACTN|nr:hypothetical protein [Longispora fulva]MBG6138208.1 hypothetical protein [Longispora fulva]